MPEWTNREQDTTRTIPHQLLRDALDRAGFYVQDELEVGQYAIDCYVREMHLGFEADGPQHSSTRDATRDTKIWDWSRIPILRLSSAGLGDSGATDLAVAMFVAEHSRDVEERRDWGKKIGGIGDV